jgi:DNA-binding transcriptional ArsR family regulator
MLNVKMTVVNTSTTIVTTVATLYLYKEPTLTTSTRSTHHTDNNVDSSTDRSDSNAPDFAPIDLAKQMQEASLQASKLLKSLSHPDRLVLLCQLTQGEYCVGELETLVGVGQPSLSQQLSILRKDELVTTRRDGKQIYYSIASDDALAVLQLLYQRFCAKTV